MCHSITGSKEQPHKMMIFQSPYTAVPKNQQQQHIIELTVKQLAKPELCLVLHQYNNEVNHKAKISIGEKIRDSKQLWNLNQNLNKTKRESSSSSGEVDRIVAAMRLQQEKSFIRNVTILPQYNTT